jgi:hypothetical protein
MREAGDGGLFFRDRRANAVFVFAMLLTIPRFCVEMEARRLWPRNFPCGGTH